MNASVEKDWERAGELARIIRRSIREMGEEIKRLTNARRTLATEVFDRPENRRKLEASYDYMVAERKRELETWKKQARPAVRYAYRLPPQPVDAPPPILGVTIWHTVLFISESPTEPQALSLLPPPS